MQAKTRVTPTIRLQGHPHKISRLSPLQPMPHNPKRNPLHLHLATRPFFLSDLSQNGRAPASARPDPPANRAALRPTKPASRRQYTRFLMSMFTIRHAMPPQSLKRLLRWASCRHPTQYPRSRTEATQSPAALEWNSRPRLQSLSKTARTMMVRPRHGGASANNGAPKTTKQMRA